MIRRSELATVLSAADAVAVSLGFRLADEAPAPASTPARQREELPYAGG